MDSSPRETSSGLSSLPVLRDLNQLTPGMRIVPHIIGFVVRRAPEQNRSTIVFLNTRTWSINEIEAAFEMEMMLSGGVGGGGEKLSPASKASIEAMPVVKVEEEGNDCSICLGEFDVGGKAKEMPCKHRYHSACIEKWLEMCGSCPLCRYIMPPIENENDREEDADADAEARHEEEETTEGLAEEDGDDPV